MKEISVEDALQINGAFIDLRSPNEFKEDHLPGAINLPLLTDEERAVVGTLYKGEGADKAKVAGLEFVAPRLPGLVANIRQHLSNGPGVIYCWRGGARSKAVAQILDLMNIPAYRLRGGYKAFRRHVNEFFAQQLNYPIIVLHGFTGTGKTEIIQKLIELDVNAIDLEGLANNRGSVFGQVGLGEQPTQKRFETKLFANISRVPQGNWLVVEGESKRIGRNSIPTSFFQSMQNGVKILIEDDISSRVSRIIKEYGGGKQHNQEELARAIPFLTKRLGKSRVKDLTDMVIAGNYPPVVEYLLEEYYDPLYSGSPNVTNEFKMTVSGSDPEEAAKKLVKLIDSL